MRPVTPEARRRAAAQLLHRPAGATPASVARHLLGVQAQDAHASPLAFRARIPGLARADVEAAFARRELVTTWLFRGTLHTVAAEDVGWLHSLVGARTAAGIARRLAQQGVAPAEASRGAALLEDFAREAGVLPRGQARERLAAAGITVEGQAFVHVVAQAALEGRVLVGPGRAFVAWEEWVGREPPPAREDALAELGRRYLAAHPEAAPRDLAKWSGLPLGEARTALAAARPAPGAGDAAPVPLRLLPAFDELLLGWADRTPVVPAEHSARVHQGGIIRGVVTQDGRAAGTWRRAGVELFPNLEVDASALAAEEEDVARFERAAAEEAGA